MSGADGLTALRRITLPLLKPMSEVAAARKEVANFFGGVLVLTQRPFKVGERIEVAGIRLDTG